MSKLPLYACANLSFKARILLFFTFLLITATSCNHERQAEVQLKSPLSDAKVARFGSSHRSCLAEDTQIFRSGSLDPGPVDFG